MFVLLDDQENSIPRGCVSTTASELIIFSPGFGANTPDFRLFGAAFALIPAFFAISQVPDGPFDAV
jgi:hypothetical protein